MEGGEVIAIISATPDSGGGVTNALSDINFPGVVLLASSGIVALIFIVRWMIRFQRDFTNFYVDENNKLRMRVDDLEAEAQIKDRELTDTKRKTLGFELDQARNISNLESKIARQQEIIEDLQRRLGLKDQ